MKTSNESKEQAPNTELRTVNTELRTSRCSAFCILCSAFCILCSAVCGQVVFLDLPHSIRGNVGDTIAVPILISGQSGRGVISADITLSYRDAVVTGTSSCNTGDAVPGGWLAYANPVPDTLFIAMAGADPLMAGDTLVILKFVRQQMDTTSIIFARAQLNEGSIPCSTGRGMVGSVAESPTQHNAAARVLSIRPNPACSPVVIRLSGSAPAGAEIEVLDSRGSIIRRLTGRQSGPGGFETRWDGCNDLGRKSPAGIYFCRFHTASFTTQQKFLLLE